MTQHLTVRITNNFGTKAIYPACQFSTQLADLIGTKTFTDTAVQKLLKMGFSLTVKQPTL
jgi:hypothetical protein